MLVLVRIGQAVQEMAHAIEARALLVVGLDHHPGGIRRIGMEEHGVLGIRIVVPHVQRLDVDGRQFPVLERVIAARDKAAQLFLAAHREPVLVKMHAAVHQHAFQLRRLAQELQVFVRRAEAHYPLDTGAVVPGAVEKDHFAGGRQMLDIALEEPLPALVIRGLVQRHHASATRVQVLHVALDGAALAGGVTALEQDHDFLAALAHPVLYLEQFDLQLFFLRLVFGAAHPGAVRVTGGQRRVIALLVAAMRRMRHRQRGGPVADRFDRGGARIGRRRFRGHGHRGGGVHQRLAAAGSGSGAGRGRLGFRHGDLLGKKAENYRPLIRAG